MLHLQDQVMKYLYMLQLQYLWTLTVQSQISHISSLQLIKLLKNNTFKLFLRDREESAKIFTCNAWFDFDCKQTRARSVDKYLNLQNWRIMMRLYQYLVYFKIQTFLPRMQESLKRKLLESINFYKDFQYYGFKTYYWSSILVFFGEKLHFFPNATSMPHFEGIASLFFEVNMMTQFKILANDKCEHISFKYICMSIIVKNKINL